MKGEGEKNEFTQLGEMLVLGKQRKVHWTCASDLSQTLRHEDLFAKIIIPAKIASSRRVENGVARMKDKICRANCYKDAEEPLGRGSCDGNGVGSGTSRQRQISTPCETTMRDR